MSTLAPVARLVNPRPVSSIKTSTVLFDAADRSNEWARPFGRGILAYTPQYKATVDAEDRRAYASGNTVSAAEYDAKIEFEAEMASFMDSMERGFFHA